jgi:hypothetical protein
VFFVLFCFILFCFVLFCFVLFCFVLFCFSSSSGGNSVLLFRCKFAYRCLCEIIMYSIANVVRSQTSSSLPQIDILSLQQMLAPRVIGVWVSLLAQTASPSTPMAPTTCKIIIIKHYHSIFSVFLSLSLFNVVASTLIFLLKFCSSIIHYEHVLCSLIKLM